MLGECWSSVADDGPTFTQHWLDVLCSRGEHSIVSEADQHCSAKSKGINCLLENSAVTTFWVCATELYSNNLPTDIPADTRRRPSNGKMLGQRSDSGSTSSVGWDIYRRSNNKSDFLTIN